jgi:hypothetical protein
MEEVDWHAGVWDVTVTVPADLDPRIRTLSDSVGGTRTRRIAT